MGAININSVGKIYPNGTRALEDVNIEINDGEFVVLDVATLSPGASTMASKAGRPMSASPLTTPLRTG